MKDLKDLLLEAFLKIGSDIDLEEEKAVPPIHQMMHKLQQARKTGMYLVLADYIISPETKGFLWTLKYNREKFYLSAKMTARMIRALQEDGNLRLKAFFKPTRNIERQEDYFNYVSSHLRAMEEIEKADVLESKLYEPFDTYSDSMKEDLELQVAEAIQCYKDSLTL